MSGPAFEVLDPAWLLAKLFHDFKRLKADEEQPTIMLYTAFDFFVTGYSLVDWIANWDPRTTKAENDRLRTQLRTPIIVKICGDVANHIKHFRRDRPTTTTTHRAPPALYWVELSQTEAHAASLPECCPVQQLAEAVLAHWKAYFEGQDVTKRA
jgi:hypothetical protein